MAGSYPIETELINTSTNEDIENTYNSYLLLNLRSKIKLSFYCFGG